MSQVKHLLQAKGGTIFSIAPDAPVLEAIKQMAEHRIGALLVMRGERAGRRGVRTRLRAQGDPAGEAPPRRRPSPTS